jgi:hypothetical protein
MVSRASARLLTITLMLSFAVGGPTFSARADACEPTKPLTNATLTTNDLPNGGLLSRYQFAPGTANSSGYAGRLTVAKGNLNFFAVTPTHSNFTGVASHESLSSSVAAVAHVNSDFFDFSSHMPYSAIGTNGRLDYSPQGSSQVVGIRLVSATSQTGIRGKTYLQRGSKKAAVSGLNLPSVPSNGITAFSAKYFKAQLPAGAYSVLVVSGKVKAKFENGSTVRPNSGYLFSAKGTSVAGLKALPIGSSVTYKLPTATIPSLTKDRVTSNGTVSTTAGKVLANISAVNFYTSPYSAGLVYFNDEYSGTTPSGNATVILNSSSVVTRVSTSGFASNVSTGYQVLQFYGSAATQAPSFTTGMKVVIKRTFTATTKSTYQTIFGAGHTIISNGVVVASCVGNVDTIRPRTALAWDSFGNVYLATTTMGRDWPDGGAGGYRVGGSTVHQLADWLKTLGATHAVSLDGGGSTTMLAMLSGSYHRVDLPDGVWTRWIPAGLALTNR